MSDSAIEHGDAEEVLATLDEGVADALVTDPPAGISLVGRSWDDDRGGRREWVAWFERVARLALRALRPGAHGLVWSLPRTSHWTATALEWAGFEVLDVVVHLFGSGRPAGADVGRLLAAEAARRDRARAIASLPGAAAPAPPAVDAAAWAGYGTRLKPAAEHWLLVRRPLEGTVVENVLAHGTGAINVGATRSAGDRFPANVVLSCCGSDPHDEGCVVALLDAQAGERGAYCQTNRRKPSTSLARGELGAVDREAPYYDDAGGPSRFYYVAKVRPEERSVGLEDFFWRVDVARPSGVERVDEAAWLALPEHHRLRGNPHPTVKSIELMRYLVRLVARPGAIVLDPFGGTGSTAIAADAEGATCLAVERELDYVEVGRARLARWGSR